MRTERIELYHEIVGTGPPLLLLAGFGSDRLTWSFQRANFASHFQTILVDNRGVGRSPVPPGPYTIREMSADVAHLLRTLRTGPTHVVGHSMGGSIAQELALNYPDLVDRLVLVSSFSRGGERVRPILQEWVNAWKDGLDPDLMARKVLPALYSPNFLRNPLRVQSTLGFLKAHPHPPNPAGLEAQLAAVVKHDTWERLPQLIHRTLVLASEQDRLTPPAITRELAERVPSARYHLLPDSGHVCMIEQADLFAETVVEFLISP